MPFSLLSPPPAPGRLAAGDSPRLAFRIGLLTAKAAPQSPSRQRRLLALILACGVVGAAAAQMPPEGRWRCYQPPSYGVLAWFDLTGGGIAVNGNPPLPVRFDAGRLGLPAAALPPHGEALYLAPGSARGDAERHTLVLLRTPGQKPGGLGWERQPRCYLTTH